MGKYFWAGILLLILLPALSLGITGAICTIHEPICQDLLQAQQATIAQDRQQAYALANQANQRWQKYRPISAAFTDHAPIEAADSLFAQLELYSRLDDVKAFAACCTQLRMQVDAILQAAQARWWDLL